MKQTESRTQRTVDALRREYEELASIPLCVRLVGDMCAANMSTIVPTLVEEDFASKPVGHQKIVDTKEGLRAHVTRVYRAEWFSVNHRVGWVDRKPVDRIQDATGRKARQLPRYQTAAGPHVRLLLVADRYFNSGKLMLAGSAPLDTRGFQHVYFFSYPESVAAWDDTGNMRWHPPDHP